MANEPVRETDRHADRCNDGGASMSKASGSSSRRDWLRGLAALTGACVFSSVRFGHAAPAKLGISVPHRALGAIVAAVGGSLVDVQIDDALGEAEIRIGKDTVAVKNRILLKGQGQTRRRYLDDARNATKIASLVRDALAKAHPDHAADFTQRHQAWSRPFARKVLQWQQALAKSPVRGKRVRDVHGRIYLLEWAGATVSDAGNDTGPAALASLPRDLDAATPIAYEAYVQRLVDALT